MSLESATYISQLSSADPAEGDPVVNAADHLRLIKSVLKVQFPNLGAAAMTSTSAQLSYGVVPTGGVIMWTGATTSIPTGWALCDGGTYVKTDGSGNLTVPNLKDKFIAGAGNLYAVGATGGAVSNTPTAVVGGTALTIDQLPPIPVSISDPGHNHTLYDPGHTHSYNGVGGSGLVASAGGFSNSYASTTGVGHANITIYAAVTGISAYVSGPLSNTHTHTSTISAVPTLPPYYALAFICKL